MARLSNAILIVVNILTIAISLCAMGTGIWLHVGPETACLRGLQAPLLIGGSALLVLSLVGLVGSWCRISFLMYLYLSVLFVVMVGLLGFLYYMEIVVGQIAQESDAGIGFGEENLGKYSSWVQNSLVNEKNWAEIKSCLIDVKLCQRIPPGKDEDFYQYKLPPIQSGCCKPPSHCGFHFKNATWWTMPGSSPANSDHECKKWSNNAGQMCLDCKLCKTSILNSIVDQWLWLSIIILASFFAVLGVCRIGCCALENKAKGRRLPN